jgi:3-deoxy-D-manno-octulosonic-acid transferase
VENANEFIFQIEPDIAIFIRYDIWRNYLKVLKKRGIPSLLINATQPSNGFFRNFPPTRNFIRSNMGLFSEIITSDEVHSEYFKSIGINNVQTLTDTRFDRIAEFVNGAQVNIVFPKELIQNDSIVLVAGSVWDEDIDIISEGIKQYKLISSANIKVIYVPHEPTQEHLAYLISKLDSYVLLSEILKDVSEGKINQISDKLNKSDIVVDSIGYLLRLYNYADLAYIGGAFGAGIHSVTEAAGYGLPLVTGPNLSKSSDANYLEKIGCLTKIKNAEELLIWLENCIQNPKIIEIQSQKSRNYIFEKIGSSEKVFRIIESYLKLS